MRFLRVVDENWVTSWIRVDLIRTVTIRTAEEAVRERISPPNRPTIPDRHEVAIALDHDDNAWIVWVKPADLEKMAEQPMLKLLFN